MDAKPISADYSLGALLGTESQRASIDKILDKYAFNDEERERKRRQRMLEAQRAMSAVGHSSAPRGQNHLFSIHGDGSFIDDSQDGAIADGLSLAMGSEAHKVYVQNRQGMDQFERQRADMSEIGFGTKGDREAPGADEYHDEYYDEMAHQDAETAEGNELQASKRTMGVRVVQEDHVIKHEQAERIIAMAQARAASTATTADDDFVDDHLPSILGRSVHDISKSDLDKEESMVDVVLDKIAEIEPDLEM